MDEKNSDIQIDENVEERCRRIIQLDLKNFVRESEEEKELPLSELQYKVLLTVEEANRLFGLGICSIRERMREQRCPFSIKVGDKKQLIDRQKLEQYIHEHKRF